MNKNIFITMMVYCLLSGFSNSQCAYKTYTVVKHTKNDWRATEDTALAERMATVAATKKPVVIKFDTRQVAMPYVHDMYPGNIVKLEFDLFKRVDEKNNAEKDHIALQAQLANGGFVEWMVLSKLVNSVGMPPAPTNWNSQHSDYRFDAKRMHALVPAKAPEAVSHDGTCRARVLNFIPATDAKWNANANSMIELTFDPNNPVKPKMAPRVRRASDLNYGVWLNAHSKSPSPPSSPSAHLQGSFKVAAQPASAAAAAAAGSPTSKNKLSQPSLSLSIATSSSAAAAAAESLLQLSAPAKK